MTSIKDGFEHRNSRIAKAILSYAQALIAGHASIDLLALEQSFTSKSFIIDLPLSDGLAVSLEIGLHPLRRRTLLKSEAFYLAETVKDYIAKTSAILTKAKRLQRAGESLACAAREAGAPVSVGRMRLGRHTSAWGVALAEVRLEFLFPGADLKTASWWVCVSDIATLRGFVAKVADIAKLRKLMRDTVSRHHAVCLIDPIAYAAMRHFGTNIPTLLARLELTRYQRRGNVAYEWYDGVVHACFELNPTIRWMRNKVIVRQQLPQTALHAAAGRLLTDFVGHPLLATATVARVDQFKHEIWLTAHPRVPLLLMPNGKVLPVPPAEAVLPRPEPDPNGGTGKSWYEDWMFAATGIDDEELCL